MSTTSTTFGPHDAVAEETAGGGLFDRAFRRFTAAREARARELVEGHLSRLDEASLAELGYEPSEIRRIKSHSSYPSLYWI